MTPKPRTPEELWQKLVDEAGEELIEAAASVSVEQAEKDLEEAGFDVAAERARAEQFLVDLERGAIETYEPKPKRRL
jgi:hypothetical protein